MEKWQDGKFQNAFFNIQICFTEYAVSPQLELYCSNPGNSLKYNHDISHYIQYVHNT